MNPGDAQPTGKPAGLCVVPAILDLAGCGQPIPRLLPAAHPAGSTKSQVSYGGPSREGYHGGMKANRTPTDQPQTDISKLPHFQAVIQRLADGMFRFAANC
ncbi:hypothetical protein [Rubripirellula lacrimiformis]|uniref:hypothetical protein n=1 Tax=Rubripirellula lacrimiformis TaxID=1930273 RepID=UPI0011A4D66E|nr:hypothetical protein [Rubripirellula lacrimiformis]